jgi:hypothetical protein
MSDVVVDTNVPVVANDRNGVYPVGCSTKCIDRLATTRNSDRIVVDLDGKILQEYKRLLNSSGQLGPGDAFYQHIFVIWATRYAPLSSILFGIGIANMSYFLMTRD